MQSYLDCQSCLVNQALRSARFCEAPREMQERILRLSLTMLAEADWTRSPMELGEEVRKIVRRETGIDDPYVELKRRSNQEAESHIAALRDQLAAAPEPLDLAFAAAIAGNSIDYGSRSRFELADKLAEIGSHPFAVDDRPRLIAALEEASSIGVLADNAGEIVLDRLMVETILDRFGPKRVFFVVRSEPFINDALLADARESGVADLPGVEIGAMHARIPDAGSDEHETWRTVLDCDVVISKGQANYEAFSGLSGVYFLLITKCENVAHHIAQRTGRDVELGQMVLWRAG